MFIGLVTLLSQCKYFENAIYIVRRDKASRSRDQPVSVVLPGYRVSTSLVSHDVLTVTRCNQRGASGSMGKSQRNDIATNGTTAVITLCR